MCLGVCMYTCVYFRWKLFFSRVMNPDGENLFLYPLLPTPRPPSSDSGVRLSILLALWFIVAMIY